MLTAALDDAMLLGVARRVLRCDADVAVWQLVARVDNGLIQSMKYWQLSGCQARNRPTSTSLIVCCMRGVLVRPRLSSCIGWLS